MSDDDDAVTRTRYRGSAGDFALLAASVITKPNWITYSEADSAPLNPSAIIAQRATLQHFFKAGWLGVH